MHHRFRVVVMLLAGVVALGLLAGCRSRRGVDRSRVLEAENINLRQKSRTLETQMRQAHVSQDEALAREQQLRHDLVAAQEEAKSAEEARNQLAMTQTELESKDRALADAASRYNELLERQKRMAARPPAPAPVAKPQTTYGGSSPKVAALKRDLQQQLRRYNCRALNVEVRTDRSGEQRVAIVLPDAFPAGKATLAYNASAVKAVVGVSKMIQDHYPASAIRVEGHTDSDPIRKSKWGTNQRLSEARAQAVETLLTNAGISGGQVETVGLGADQPLERGSTRRAKSRNRRVEIFIAPR